MQYLTTIIASILLWFSSLFSGNAVQDTQTVETVPSQILVMKDVGEAYMDKFGLTEKDFTQIKKAGIDVIEGNFDICASDNDVQYFLTESQKAGLKVIMNAGSGEAEWGYSCNQETFPKTQKPEWQKELVISWVNKWKSNPAVYAWDISNEAGSVFPNASWYNETQSKVPDAYYLSVDQLKKAYQDVKTADPTHPVMIRMNGWFFFDNDDNFFRNGNPFGEGVADIVMVNAYSNVSDYYNEFVPTVISRAKSSINEIDPQAKIIIALGVWEEKPLWYKPKPENVKQEIADIAKHRDLLGTAYFKYGAFGSEWYLPESAPDIWNVIASPR